MQIFCPWGQLRMQGVGKGFERWCADFAIYPSIFICPPPPYYLLIKLPPPLPQEKNPPKNPKLEPKKPQKTKQQQNNLNSKLKNKIIFGKYTSEINKYHKEDNYLLFFSTDLYVGLKLKISWPMWTYLKIARK